MGKAHKIKEEEKLGVKKQLSEEEEQKIIQRTRHAFQKVGFFLWNIIEDIIEKKIFTG